MDTSHEHPAGEELLRHATWIRGLARSLVGDETTAEDIVQDTWVAALTHERPRGSLRPWLRSVVRNFARQDHRTRGRREARERHARGPSGLPDPDELSERLEMERLLTERLAKLEEPFRSTLLLRYYEGLAPKDIAQRLRIPAGTVRWRLKRGLELLRERLDAATGGDGRSWALLLLPLARPEGAAAAGIAGSSVAFSGALLMNGVLKLAVAAVAVVVLAVGLARVGWLPSSLVPGLAEPAEEVTFRPLAVDPVQAREPDVVPARDATPGASRRQQAPAAIVAPEVQAAEPARGTVVAARVVTQAGAPLSGARVVVMHGSHPVEASTGGDGTASLTLELTDKTRASVAFHALGFASREVSLVLHPGEETHAGTIALAPGGAIAGRVVDGLGFPVEGASIRLCDEEIPGRRLESMRFSAPVRAVPVTATNEQGEFRLLGVPTGQPRVWASREGWRADFSGPVEVRVGQESSGVELTLLELGPENQIRGIVVDPGGLPVPNAPLSYRHKTGGTTMSSDDMRAEEDGTFSFELAEEATLWISASDPEGRYGPASASEVETGELNLVLRLQAVQAVELAVVDASGDPVERFAFTVQSPDERTTFQSEPRVERAQGLATFRLPASTFQVRVTAPGYDHATLGPFAPDAVTGTLTASLTALPGVHGIVLADGEPVAGARVRLHPMVAADSSRVQNGFRTRNHDEVREEVTTDEEGRFLLTVRAESDYVVRADHADFAPTEWGPGLLGPTVDAGPLLLVLGTGGSIEGRVYLEGGVDPAGTIVGISRGDSYAVTQRVSSDGVFRFDGLIPGPWMVVLRDEEIYEGYTTTSTNSGSRIAAFEELEWSCEVYEGRTTYFDLRPGVEVAYELSGRLLIGGEPALGWDATLLPEHGFFGEKGPRASVDDEGRFTIQSPDAGAFRLILNSPWDHGSERFLLADVKVPSSGVWELEVETGVLVVEGVAAWDGSTVPGLCHLWRGPRGVLGITPLAGDEEGLARVEGAFVGEGSLVRPEAARLMRPDEWEALANANVRAGQETRVRVP